jgi:hypothetical protein
VDHQLGLQTFIQNPDTLKGGRQWERTLICFVLFFSNHNGNLVI